MIQSQSELIAVCLSLIASKAVLSADERALVASSEKSLFHAQVVASVREGILSGADPLGEAFSALRSAAERRALGAVYTPAPIIRSMLNWISAQGAPSRVVDPGAGSGRFILAAGECFPQAKLIGIEKDPLAALMLRANVAVRGWARRTCVLVQDYRDVRLQPVRGTTAFVGNPPYVRHHDISDQWKKWYVEEFAKLGIRASALAGLHLHFFLQTLLLSRRGDIGAFVTSSEWLDVNYGAALRKLMVTRLGGTGLHVIEPSVEVFPGTATTAAITCFRADAPSTHIRVQAVRRLSQLEALSKGKLVPLQQMADQPKWSIIVRPSKALTATGDTQLGEIFRVHRGQVTGANGIWIAGKHSKNLPLSVQFPTVTKAKDLLNAGAQLRSVADLRRVIDIPPDLDQLSEADRREVLKFLKWAKSAGADQSYIARHRKRWWSVGLKEPAAILCTYMARRPPQFTVNSCNARHINIAHGLYPRESMSAAHLDKVVSWLNENTTTSQGRTYAGGLTKFEPGEIERLQFPAKDLVL